MKNKLLVMLVCSLAISFSGEAQFFKKLKKKAEQAAERTILNRTDEEVSKKTDQTIDSIMSPKKGKTKEKKSNGIFDVILNQTPNESATSSDEMSLSSMGKTIPAPPDNNVKLPDSYQFSYQTTMEVKSNNNTYEAQYLLQPGETYYAKRSSGNDFTAYVVYDNLLNTEVTFAEIKGQKLSGRQKMDIFTKARMVGAYKDAPDRQVKPLESKMLLGFKCEGYEITSQTGTTQLWVTNDAPATLYTAMFEKRTETPNSPFTKNTMIMEVNFTSNESTDKNYQMVCTQLQPKTMAFNLTDYKE